MVGDDLTIMLFLVGTGISVAVSAMSQAGWKHRILIGGMFTIAATLILSGISWIVVKDSFPKIAAIVSQIATHPASWFVMIVSAFTLSAVTRRNQNRQNEPERTIMSLALVTAGIAALIFIGSLVIYFLSDNSQIKNPTTNTTSIPHPPAAPPTVVLTSDQRQFRIELKQFALTCVPNLTNAQAKVFSELKAHEKEMSKGSPQSVALHFFIHFATGSFNRPEMISKLARVDIDSLDVNALQDQISYFFGEYVWMQGAVADLNDIVKDDLSSMESMKQWLSVDNQCQTELQKLKIWSEANERLRSIQENQMASGQSRLWAHPVKVNY